MAKGVDCRHVMYVRSARLMQSYQCGACRKIRSMKSNHLPTKSDSICACHRVQQIGTGCRMPQQTSMWSQYRSCFALVCASYS